MPVSIQIGLVVCVVVGVVLLLVRDVRWVRSCEEPEPQCTPSRRRSLTGHPRTEYMSKRYAWKALEHINKIKADAKVDSDNNSGNNS